MDRDLAGRKRIRTKGCQDNCVVKRCPSESFSKVKRAVLGATHGVCPSWCCTSQGHDAGNPGREEDFGPSEGKEDTSRRVETFHIRVGVSNLVVNDEDGCLGFPIVLPRSGENGV